MLGQLYHQTHPADTPAGKPSKIRIGMHTVILHVLWQIHHQAHPAGTPAGKPSQKPVEMNHAYSNIARAWAAPPPRPSCGHASWQLTAAGPYFSEAFYKTPMNNRPCHSGLTALECGGEQVVLIWQAQEPMLSCALQSMCGNAAQPLTHLVTPTRAQSLAARRLQMPRLWGTLRSATEAGRMPGVQAHDSTRCDSNSLMGDHVGVLEGLRDRHVGRHR